MSSRQFPEEKETQDDPCFLLPAEDRIARASLSRPGQRPPSLSGVIGDIVRTKICVPGSLFYVESIDARIAVATSGRKRKHQHQQAARPRAVRLLLSDGELSIQALLVPSLHPLVDDGSLKEGCLVRLERFRLRVLLRPDSGADCGPPTVFLVVEKVVAEACNIEKALVFSKQPQSETMVKDDEHDKGAAQLRELPTTELKAPGFSKVGDISQNRIVHESRTSSNYAAELPVKAQNSLCRVEKGQRSNNVSVEGLVATGRYRELPGGVHNFAVEQSSHATGLGSGQALPVKVRGAEGDSSLQQPLKRARIGPEAGSSSSSSSTSPALPWVSTDLTRPVKLTTLKSIPLLPYKQNWMVNVLAIVSELSNVEPSPLPPYTGKQRTARLADPSTGKRVLLTVFLDPEDFTPKVGSAVILLGVKNHRFEGGSLKKYASDRPKDGRSWWFENPQDLDWCDVRQLKDWWLTICTTP